MYYQCSENKGADQPFDHHTGDLHLFFSHMQKAGFLMSSFLMILLNWYLSFSVTRLTSLVREDLFWFYKQVLHKPGCKATEDGQELGILDIKTRDTCRNIGTDQPLW